MNGGGLFSGHGQVGSRSSAAAIMAQECASPDTPPNQSESAELASFPLRIFRLIRTSCFSLEKRKEVRTREKGVEEMRKAVILMSYHNLQQQAKTSTIEQSTRSLILVGKQLRCPCSRAEDRGFGGGQAPELSGREGQCVLTSHQAM